MSGHTRWDPMPKEVSPPPCTIQYVKGYIMALEDMIKDLETFEHGDGCIALEQAMDVVKQSLASARRTLEVLTK